VDGVLAPDPDPEDDDERSSSMSMELGLWEAMTADVLSSGAVGNEVQEKN
jgi:hypothetical protein